jgi:outer membrane protein assembly factor BamA
VSPAHPALALLLGLLLLGASPGAWGQEGGDRIESLTVDAIELEAPPREDKERLLELSGLTVGRPFSSAEVRRAVKVLYQLGRFGDVRVYASREGNTVRLRLVLPPRPSVRDIVIEAQGAAPESAIQRGLGLKPQDELDPSSLPDRRRAIARALERAGYRRPAIGLALKDPDDAGGSVVLVRVDEGAPTRIHNIVLLGELRRPSWRVRERLGLSEGDVLDLDRVEESIKQLALDYKADGYFSAVVKIEDAIEIQGTEPPEADLLLSINTGPKITVAFSGNHEVPLSELKAAADSLRETGIGPGALAEAQERILGIYERRGHFKARVEAKLKTSPDGVRAEVLFRLDEGPIGRVVRLEFPGNHVLDDDLLRQTVVRVVEESLAADLDRPASDPEVIDLVVGAGSIPPKRRWVQPHGPDPDPETIYFERAYRAAEDAIADQFRASGYPNVEVLPPKIEVLPGGSRLVVRMEVKPGVRWQIGALALSGNDGLSGPELLEIADLEPGQPLSFAKVEASRRPSGLLPKPRHLYARVRSRSGRSGPGAMRCAPPAPRPSRPLQRPPPAERGLRRRAGLRDPRGPGGPRPGHRHSRRTKYPAALVEAAHHRAGEVLRSPTWSSPAELRLGVFGASRSSPSMRRPRRRRRTCWSRSRRPSNLLEIGGRTIHEEGVRIFATYTHSNLLGSAPLSGQRHSQRSTLHAPLQRVGAPRDRDLLQ